MQKIFTWFAEHPEINTWTKNLIATAILLIAVLFARKFIKKVLSIEGKDFKKQTVFPILQEILSFAVYFLAFSVFLEIIGISSTPIWTMVSAISVAIGFGAQQVMKDFFSGILIILEDQYKKGDTIKINGMMGTVEKILLRTTEIRDGVDGSLHIISNGEIRTVSNFSKNYVYAVVDLPLPYDSDLDETISILNTLASKFPKTKSILEPIRVLGVRGFDNISINIRITCKTKTGDNWMIERELRKYFKQGLEKEGIELPSGIVYPLEQASDN